MKRIALSNTESTFRMLPVFVAQIGRLSSDVSKPDTRNVTRNKKDSEKTFIFDDIERSENTAYLILKCGQNSKMPVSGRCWSSFGTTMKQSEADAILMILYLALQQYLRK